MSKGNSVKGEGGFGPRTLETELPPDFHRGVKGLKVTPVAPHRSVKGWIACCNGSHVMQTCAQKVD